MKKLCLFIFLFMGVYSAMAESQFGDTGMNGMGGLEALSSSAFTESAKFSPAIDANEAADTLSLIEDNSQHTRNGSTITKSSENSRINENTSSGLGMGMEINKHYVPNFEDLDDSLKDYAKDGDATQNASSMPIAGSIVIFLLELTLIFSLLRMTTLMAGSRTGRFPLLGIAFILASLGLLIDSTVLTDWTIFLRSAVTFIGSTALVLILTDLKKAPHVLSIGLSTMLFSGVAVWFLTRTITAILEI